jgi:hypothetical protein
LETGKGTPRKGSVSLPSTRTIWSDPPPTPQVQMKSIGREGYFSCPKADDAPRISANATTNPTHFSPLRFMVIVLQFVPESDPELKSFPRRHSP